MKMAILTTGAFPADFMFQLDDKEWENLRFQIGTAKKVEKTRFNPYAFTEQGIAP